MLSWLMPYLRKKEKPEGAKAFLLFQEFKLYTYYSRSPLL
jgi:hypothetical protein